MVKIPCVYILASRRNGTLYTGITSDLSKRVWEHKNNLVEGFSKRYGVHRLVWYEVHETMDSAIQREKRIKKWNRKWKLSLIEQSNPQWKDLFDNLGRDLVGFRKTLFQTRMVIPAEAGIQNFQRLLDSRFRGSDGSVGSFRMRLI